MATLTTEYSERTVTITIVTDQYALDFSSKRFHIDVLDVLHSYFNLDIKNSAKISSTGKLDADNTVLRINSTNASEYCGTSVEHLLSKGIQFWANDEHTLKIRMHDLMNGGIGFTTNEVTVDIPNPENPVEVERAHTTIMLFPKLIQGDIHLVDEGDASLDTQLKDYERRPDYVWSDTEMYEDMMYVNTSAGTTNIGRITEDGIENESFPLDHQYVPMYCIETSALLPSSIWFPDPHGTDFGVGFDFDAISSCLMNTITNQKTQDLPFSATDPEDFTYTDEPIDCKLWTITQYLTNDKQDEVNLNQVYLGLPMSGMYYGEPPAETKVKNAILYENGNAIGLEITNRYLKK